MFALNRTIPHKPQILFFAAAAMLGFPSETRADVECWDVWTLCEGSIPCEETICVDIDDLVATIECSIDNTCDDNSIPKVPISISTKLRAITSESGGIVVGSARSGSSNDFVCWNASDKSEGSRYACASAQKLRSSEPGEKPYK